MITISKEGSDYRLDAEVWLPKPVDEVFPFFSDAHNLEEITPPMVRFNVLTPKPIPMQAGTLIDYKLRIRGVPVRWTTKIVAWEPNQRFVDEQLKGPYAKWHHEHRFVAKDGGTLCTDTVHYALPLGVLGSVAHRLIVKNDVRKIFEYRQQALLKQFT